MPVFEVKPLPKKKVNSRSILAEFCYFYPSYKLSEARRIPGRDVDLMLRVARKKRAELFYNLTHIAAAPHTRKGEGVKKLSNGYRKVIGG